MKRIFYNILLAMKEAKHNKIVLILCLLIMVGLVTVAMSLFSSAVDIPKSFKDSTIDKYTELNITVNNYDLDNIEEFVDDNVMIAFSANKITNNIYLSSETKEELFESDAGAGLYFDESSIYYDTIKNFGITSGHIWKERENKKVSGYYGIWINEGLSDNLDVNIGSHIIYNEDLSDEGEHLIVRGIYRTVQGVTLPSFILPYNFIKDRMEITNTVMKMELYISGGEKVYENIIKIVELELDVVDTNNLFLSIKGIRNMVALLWAIFMIVIFFGVFIIYNLISMIIMNRDKYIGLLKALGKTDYNILSSYFILIQFVFVLSILVSLFTSNILNNYIVDIFSVQLNILLDIYILWYFPFIIFGVVDVIFIIFLFFINLRIKRIVITDMIKDLE